MPDDAAAIHLESVSRAYPSGGDQVWALRDVSFSVTRGEAVAVTGPSGSGKTTLLNLVAGLERPSSGHVIVLGEQLDGLPESKLTAFRARSIGFVFQDPHLLPGLTALENVVVARLPWSGRHQLEEKARELLAAVGLQQRMDFPPARLSGGERQRVGIARALLAQPALLLADEPTGNLDASTTEDVIGVLEKMRGDLRLTLLLATHDPAVAAIASRVVRLIGGQVDDDRVIDGGTLEVRTLE